MDTAKVFWSGRSQAIRLPKQYRLNVNKVQINKHGNTLIIEPIAQDWSWLDALPGKLDDDAIQATKESTPQQSRPELDQFFP